MRGDRRNTAGSECGYPAGSGLTSHVALTTQAPTGEHCARVGMGCSHETWAPEGQLSPVVVPLTPSLHRTFAHGSLMAQPAAHRRGGNRGPGALQSLGERAAELGKYVEFKLQLVGLLDLRQGHCKAMTKPLLSHLPGQVPSVLPSAFLPVPGCWGVAWEHGVPCQLQPCSLPTQWLLCERKGPGDLFISSDEPGHVSQRTEQEPTRLCMVFISDDSEVGVLWNMLCRSHTRAIRQG